MSKSNRKKYKLKNVVIAGVFCFTILPFSRYSKAHASTSLMVSGHAGLVGQATFGSPPVGSDYSTIRVPIGLIFEARPTDNLSLYLGIDYAYNNYPGPSVHLGQTSANSSSNTTGTGSFLPLSNSINGTTPHSQNVDTPYITQAYFSYQTAIGLIRAGRMPRNWGLGIWQNSEWTPFSGLPSTTDSVALTTDFNAFDVSLYYDKYGEGVGGTSADADANAFTLEARLKSDPADASSSGVSQELGIQYSKFSHNKSNTSLNILDFYAKIYLPSFFVGAEVLYPTGSTQSPNYQSLGGAQACSTTTPDSSTTAGSQTCVSQKISALAALLKLKYQLDTNDNSSLAATEKAQKVLGTAERQRSNVIGLWAGYASGGSSQFTSPSAPASTNDITAIAMNSHIQPSFLMFNNTLPAINGMPGGAITNSTFVRLDYTFESPGIGSIGPVFVWGVLNKTNGNYGSQNSLCNDPSPTVNPNSSSNLLCVGGSNNLGAEVDISYRYTTLDRVTFGLDGGYWFVGDAWQIYGKSAPGSVYGLRASIATEF